MLTSLLPFLNSTTENWIAWSMFFKNQPKANFNIRCQPYYIWSRNKSRSKEYESIRNWVKEALLKETKETFAESGFTVLNTFCWSFYTQSFSKYHSRKFISVKCFNFYISKRKDFFPARSQEISKILKSEKVYVGEMQKCYNLTEKL